MAGGSPSNASGKTPSACANAATCRGVGRSPFSSREITAAPPGTDRPRPAWVSPNPVRSWMSFCGKSSRPDMCLPAKMALDNDRKILSNKDLFTFSANLTCSANLSKNALARNKLERSFFAAWRNFALTSCASASRPLRAAHCEHAHVLQPSRCRSDCAAQSGKASGGGTAVALSGVQTAHDGGRNSASSERGGGGGELP